MNIEHFNFNLLNPDIALVIICDLSIIFSQNLFAASIYKFKAAIHLYITDDQF